MIRRPNPESKPRTSETNVWLHVPLRPYEQGRGRDTHRYEITRRCQGGVEVLVSVPQGKRPLHDPLVKRYQRKLSYKAGSDSVITNVRRGGDVFLSSSVSETRSEQRARRLRKHGESAESMLRKHRLACFDDLSETQQTRRNNNRSRHPILRLDRR